jgi:hypothetical protein
MISRCLIVPFFHYLQVSRSQASLGRMADGYDLTATSSL